MKITLHNYEAYLTDYFDGTLSEKDIRELKEFLLQHPELDIQLEEVLTLPELNAEEVYTEKTQLFKTQYDWDKKILQDKMISQLEGELSQQEAVYLKERIAADPELQAQWRLTQATRLQPDLSLVYPHKHLLYRRAGFFMTWPRMAAVAAMIIFATGLGTSLLIQGDAVSGADNTMALNEPQNYPAPSPVEIPVPSQGIAQAVPVSAGSVPVRYIYVERPVYKTIEVTREQPYLADPGLNLLAIQQPEQPRMEQSQPAAVSATPSEGLEWKGFVAKKVDSYTADVITRDTLNAVVAQPAPDKIWSTRRVIAVAAKTINKITDRPVKVVEKGSHGRTTEYEVMSFQ